MTFLKILYSFFLMPIQLVFEIVFSYAQKLTGNKVGLAIIALSLAINLLVLPLYKRADAMQEEERNMEAKLKHGVEHIKKTFKGDKKTMMLQTYYRQNNYSPLHVLRSAVSLFLQIPFFIVAYRFLSGLDMLNGVAFGPIADLGAPDKLLTIGSISINLLPFVMTFINAISTAIFTRDYPLKTKMQLYGMAAFFLVFLYNSPSGLVFYWTLNNLFSLVKTIFYKIKNPKKVIRYLLFTLGIAIFGFGIFAFTRNKSFIRLLLFAVVGIVMTFPFLLVLIKKKFNLKLPQIQTKPNRKIFFSVAIYLTLLLGVLIPSALVNSSPEDFIIVGSSLHPLWYVNSTFLVAAGFFILWLGIFYWLFSPTAKVIIERALLVVCAVSTVNYLFFGKNYGTVSADLIFDSSNIDTYNFKAIILNLAVIAVLTIVVLLVSKYKINIMKGIILTAIFAIVCMSGINFFGTFRSLAAVDLNNMSYSDGNKPHITLSKDGQNVLVFMLDRGMGEYIPYIMSDYPELMEKFSGFTYYSNVISFGKSTNTGTPALFGGYEYTPVEMNKRDSESLASKHNEALKVMPVLFEQNGYQVTVCDPPYAGYKIVPDLSIYDEYPDIQAYNTQGHVQSADNKASVIESRFRNFFCYSFMKVVPLMIQPTLYNSGMYHQLDVNVNPSFVKDYDVLKSLSKITVIDQSKTNCFVMIDNESPHEGVEFSDDDFLQPFSSGKPSVAHPDYLMYNGISLNISNQRQWSNYQTNIAVLKRLGEWFDFLREQDVYDNTRIILVSDHGFCLSQIDELCLDEKAYSEILQERDTNVENYFPLLMVKDFNSTGFTTSDAFMTNADVPTLATSNIIDSPTNPFTGKPINNSEKYAHEQMVFATNYWNASENNGNTYLPGNWLSVHDSIWNKNNWKLVSENTVLPE